MHFVVKVAGRRVAEDQYITFGNRLCFIPSIPYGKFTAVLVVTNVPGGFHVVFLGRCRGAFGRAIMQSV